jgi:cysteinyl-tRNA synthetase
LTAEFRLGGWETARPTCRPPTERLAALRTAAMVSKDFRPGRCAEIRPDRGGVEVRMSKAGVELVPGPDFDPAKLEALR